MKILESYLLKNLSSVFLTTFLPLFAIASVVFSIKLAAYTAVIKINILEMIQLYLFVLPEILFYILPISFFIAAALSIFRLSNDNEIVVLFSLGIQPSFILKALAKPALILSLILAFDFYYLFPHSKTLSVNFREYKKSEAKFNLSASEFGNSFGDWLLYLGSKDEQNKTFGDVFLFNKKDKEEILISAQQAQVINNNGLLQLKLTNGEGYLYSQQKFSQVDFRKMFINDKLHASLTKYKTPYEYWLSNPKDRNRRNMFITDTLLTLFPLISLFMVLTISVVQTRHQKSRIYLYLFLATIAYYGMTLGLAGILKYYTIPVVFVVWTSVTYWLYRKQIVEKF